MTMIYQGFIVRLPSSELAVAIEHSDGGPVRVSRSGNVFYNERVESASLEVVFPVDVAAALKAQDKQGVYLNGGADGRDRKDRANVAKLLDILHERSLDLPDKSAIKEILYNFYDDVKFRRIDGVLNSEEAWPAPAGFGLDTEAAFVIYRKPESPGLFVGGPWFNPFDAMDLVKLEHGLRFGQWPSAGNSVLVFGRDLLLKVTSQLVEAVMLAGTGVVHAIRRNRNGEGPEVGGPWKSEADAIEALHELYGTEGPKPPASGAWVLVQAEELHTLISAMTAAAHRGLLVSPGEA